MKLFTKRMHLEKNMKNLDKPQVSYPSQGFEAQELKTSKCLDLRCSSCLDINWPGNGFLEQRVCAQTVTAPPPAIGPIDL
jgi:hypothetical protein